jgi:beta-glucanase (GH16 family)
MREGMKMLLTAFATAGVMMTGWCGILQLQQHGLPMLGGEQTSTVINQASISVPTVVNEPPSASRLSPAAKEDLSTPQANPSQWKPTFTEDFTGKTLDTSHWMDCYPGGVRTHSNNEQQYYASDAVTRTGDGLLLTAQRRKMGGKSYTSGMICSNGHFAQQYGWFEIRARVPQGQGMWPAFWLLPEDNSWPPEIDILEILGHEPNRVYLSNHWRDEQGQHGHQTRDFKGPDFSKDFHTFAVHWTADEIVWYVDGHERSRSNQYIPHHPMFVIANLAVGGDWPGMPNDSTRFPAKMEIKYIHVFQRVDR